MRKIPEFRSFDAFFDYLAKKLRHGAWDTNPVRHDFTIFAYRYDMEKREQPLAKFLAAKADKLIAAGERTVLDRLRAHVRRYFAQELWGPFSSIPASRVARRTLTPCVRSTASWIISSRHRPAPSLSSSSETRGVLQLIRHLHAEL